MPQLRRHEIGIRAPVPAEIPFKVDREPGDGRRPQRAVLARRLRIAPLGRRRRRQLPDRPREDGLAVGKPQHQDLAGLRQTDDDVLDTVQGINPEVMQNDGVADEIKVPDIVPDVLILPSDTAVTGIDGNDADRKILGIPVTADQTARVAGGDKKDVVPDIGAEARPDPYPDATLVERPVPDKLARRHVERLEPVSKGRDIEPLANRYRLQKAQAGGKQACLLAGCRIKPVDAVL